MGNLLGELMKFKNLGGRNLILTVLAGVAIYYLDGIDPKTKAYLISGLAGMHSLSRGVADGLSKGETASK